MILSNLPEALNLQGSEAHRVHFAQRDFLLAYHPRGQSRSSGTEQSDG
jgi:hypothetical protein